MDGAFGGGSLVLAGYEGLLGELVAEAQRDDEVVGVLLTGSLARGDALPGTDVDLRVILGDGMSRPALHEVRGGVPVEWGYADERSARDALKKAPMHVYAYLDGRILHDPEGVLARLRQHAQERFEGYRVSDAERAELAANLRYPAEKIRIAMAGGDLLKAAFVTATTSWYLMEGLWAASDRPLPPNSSVRPHLGDLAGPPEVEKLYGELFVADVERRVEVALSLYDWVLGELGEGRPAGGSPG
ncbi:nucleotidyltransferase domain-containing protein [Kribbella sp. NPDC056345]|uniref:nucleotidyltransferase domain-containing protein n=1 Tax=Kribbella sp. NPDC056345 TaxID=3345789 RepID=UPI0035DE97E5